MYYKRLFYNWLQQKGLLKKFKYNLKTYEDPIPCDHAPNIRNGIYTQPSRFIHDAFIWSDTEEGFHFWQDMSILWGNFFSDNYLHRIKQ